MLEGTLSPDDYIWWLVKPHGVSLSSKVAINILDHILDERPNGNVYPWLGAPDPSTTLDLFKANRAPDSGLWILDQEEFKQWKAHSNSFMLLHGPCELPFAGVMIWFSPFTSAGCGKSYLW